MAATAGNQRIIPLEEGWNDEIKAKVRRNNSYATAKVIFSSAGARIFPFYSCFHEFFRHVSSVTSMQLQRC